MTLQGDEDVVVVSGMSGKCAKSSNIQQLADAIYNKKDMITSENNRWPRTPEVPERTGKIPDIDKFDNAFFDVPDKQVNWMDPINRMILEVTFEALIDAGFSPKSLAGTKTGIYIGSCYAESEQYCYGTTPAETFALKGSMKAAITTRISHFLKVEGPSYVCDSACSSSLFALHHAYMDLQKGNSDYAIVCGSNIILTPNLSQQFNRLGVLSRDGTCKSFDASADGYARSDGLICVILQKASTAKRCYAEVVHCMTNCDGFKEMGITFPSSDAQKVLLDEFYAQCKIPTENIGYVEAHGTGTKVGDPQELNTIEKVFCKNRKEPLLIGSIKSNLGHNEGASGVNALVKVCLIFETGLIPPNINYNKPKPSVEGLMNGNLKVVTDVTPLPEDQPYIAISNFGFGGANGHILLKKPTFKRNIQQKPTNNNPRVVCLSGRTFEAVDELLRNLKITPFNEHYIALLNSVFQEGIDKHYYRAFAIMSSNGMEDFEIMKNYESNKPLKCFFHTFGLSTMPRIFKDLPVFKEHMQEVQNIFTKHKIGFNTHHLTDKLMSCDPSLEIITTVTVQTGILKILKMLNINISEFIGSGIGEISAAYADDIITLDQAILIADIISKMLQTNSNIKQRMVIEQLNPLCHLNKKPQKWRLQKKFNNDLAAYLAETIIHENLAPIDNNDLLILGKMTKHKSAKKNNGLCICDNENNNNLLPTILGRLYLRGYSLKLDKLFLGESWPVPRGTPMISSLIKWNHKKSWDYIKFQTVREEKSFNRISLNHPNWQHIEGHIIDGRILFPATGYIYLAWSTYSAKVQVPVCFENIKFIRACTISKNADLELTVQLHRQTGNFQITEGDSIVVTGTINEAVNVENEFLDLPHLPESNSLEMLDKKDIYKELGLRGYQYQGQFKELQDLSLDSRVGHIKWTSWIPFIDNLLQVKIMQEDTRSLFVPTKISKLLIHPSKHMDIVYAAEEMEECIIPVHHFKDLDVIRSGFIEVRGLNASSIVRRKNPNPVLEVNQFIPYVASLRKDVAARVMIQIALENNYAVKIRLLEVFKEVPKTLEPLLPFIQAALYDQPLIQPEYVIMTDDKLDLNHIVESDKPILNETSSYMVIGYNLSVNVKLCKSMASVLKPGGFLISREPLNSCGSFDDCTIISKYTTDDEILYLIKPTDNNITARPATYITLNNFNWLDDIQNARLAKQNLLLVSENENYNGILGLTNCLLRESGEEKVSCFLLPDAEKPFNSADAFYKNQLDKQLAVNVLKDNEWGTYRHLIIDENQSTKTTHTYVNNLVRGDLSSLCWMQGKLSIPENYDALSDNECRVHIYEAALNFRDVMVASGKITLDAISKDRKFHECLLGIEFAGRKDNGERVMGFWESAAMANLINVKEDYLWTIPNNWSMADAATIPAVYATNIYGLLMRANLQTGESILIHSATGGIGLSAINIALYYKCKVFLTVGTEEKKEFILKNYPEIPEKYIGNSRNTTFHEMIMRETNGQGVDLILNSLADEKLQMSVKCLKYGGRFVEIGKFDLNNDSLLSMELTEKDAEYHGVMLDNIMSAPGSLLRDIGKLMEKGIIDGYIKPIPKTTFKKHELEAAFRSMTTGKHIGKIIINIREEEKEFKSMPIPMLCEAKPRFYCNPKGVYIILGGLGGFGLELADWLAIRGARNIILVSRRGLSNGYQRLRLNIWKSYNCKIVVSNDDATTMTGCKSLLNTALGIGPLCGIFNLAVVLKDAIIENQTKESFQTSFNPKAQATLLLDKLTRTMAPSMENFVVFSSVSCGRGNAGQTNYGYSNSVMERICEKRCADGFSGKAIQWGVIGDVGIVADYKEQNIEIVIGGTMHQRIANCLEVLDVFMLHDAPIVSSMVVAEKKSSKGDDDLLSVVCNLLQINDIKTVSPNSTFPELGMDSMMAVEIKQIIERDFDVFISPQELRTMTFTKLNEIATGNVETVQNAPEYNVQQIMRYIPTEAQCDQVEVIMESKNPNSDYTLYFVPGVEGMCTVFETMAKEMSLKAKCLQFAYADTCDQETIEAMALAKFNILLKQLDKTKPCNILCHSLGTTTTLELVSLLETYGYTVNLFIIDGAPLYSQKVIESLMDTSTDNLLQSSFITNIMSCILPLEIVENLKSDLTLARSFNEKVRIAVHAAPEKIVYSTGFVHNLLTSIYNRIRAELKHKFGPRLLKSKVILCKPSMLSLPNLPEDYGLSEILGIDLQIETFAGDHISVMENKELIDFIENVIKISS